MLRSHSVTSTVCRPCMTFKCLLSCVTERGAELKASISSRVMYTVFCFVCFAFSEM